MVFVKYVEGIMENKIEIYKSKDGLTQVEVNFEKDTVWLNQKQMAELFGRDRKTITRHIVNIFKEEELEQEVVCSYFEHTTQHGAIKGKTQIANVQYYNLDVIISVGYRVKSKQGTQFRQWATKRLNDYLVKGYAINEKRLEQKQMEVEYLKTGIKILGRSIKTELDGEDINFDFLKYFSKGLELLDDYDHEILDSSGLTKKEAVYPKFNDYMSVINDMYSDFDSKVFAKPKDESFLSSINQIRQSFGGVELYPSIEEKAANLLYFIVKNHSFVDGNKRIGAACFLYFLKVNNMLFIDNMPIINNETLASLTLFIATSKTEEIKMVKQLVISLLKPSLREPPQTEPPKAESSL